MWDSTWLQKGKLKSRVTMIPLNKIDSRGTISDEKVRLAQKLVGKENACTALSLVGYDDELESAMAYVFGRSFGESVPGSWVGVRRPFHLSLFLTASRMVLPQDPSTDPKCLRSLHGCGVRQ